MISPKKFLLLIANYVPPEDEPGEGEYEDPPEGYENWSTHYSHYNPQSWDGKGVTITFCPTSPRWDTVTLDGVPLHLHGEQTGREMWTNYDFINPAPTGIGGIIQAIKGSGGIKIEVTGSGTYLDHTGDCF